MADGKVQIDIVADDSDVEKKLDNVDEKAQDAADGMDELGDSSQNASKGLDAADVAAGALVANGLTALISGLGDAVSSLMNLADETREYREDMAKLDTAFTTAGHSTETAGKAYEDFYAILGESDRSVEAVNHLAELTDNEKEIAKWSKIAAGITAKFGDSLPIEGLTEAANETAKVGKVTGPLADALNWAGISEELFNERLAECNNEQERATAITDALNSMYSDAADEYNELTKETQDARRATSKMEDAQADLGAAIEPVTTAWTKLKAKALEAILPVVEKVSKGIQSLTKWMEENPQKATVLKAVIIALAVAFGTLAVAMGIHSLIGLVTKAFGALNAVMALNPITLIVAAIGALVAAFVYLWNKCEAFREFWIDLWNAVKEIVSNVVDWFVDAWNNTIECIKNAWNAVVDFFVGIWDGIKSVFSGVVDWFSNIFSDAWNRIKEIWNVVVGFFTGIWDGIKTVFSAVVDWFKEKFQAAWDAISKVWSVVIGFFAGIWTGIKNVFASVSNWFGEKFAAARDAIKTAWSTVKDFFSGVWESINDVFSGVADWFGNIFSDAWDAIKKAWGGVKDWFSDKWQDIKNAFSGASDDFSEIGANIVGGLSNGIASSWGALKKKTTGLVNNLVSETKSALDSHSPSRVYEKIGETIPQGLAVGVENDQEKAVGAMKETLARVQATVSAENARIGQGTSRHDNGLYDLVRAVGTQTAGINSLAGEYRRGNGNARPVVIELNGRELGRAVIDVGDAETVRTGKIAIAGAY